jgi:hypothetical protein
LLRLEHHPLRAEGHPEEVGERAVGIGLRATRKWQFPRAAKQARPHVTLPSRRAAGQVLSILVDSGEKCAYTFAHQQAHTERRRLAAGDYAVELEGTIVAAVERKSLPDLAGSMLSGKLTYALAELSALPRAGLVVEDRYSALFKLDYVSGGKAAKALAEAQARFPAVTVMFTKTRPLAQEWTYRFLGAALGELAAHGATADVEATFAVAGSVPPAPPSAAAVRVWAVAAGLHVSDRGRIPAAVLAAYHGRTDAATLGRAWTGTGQAGRTWP